MICGAAAPNVVTAAVFASTDGTTKAELTNINDNINNFFILFLHVRSWAGPPALIIRKTGRTFSLTGQMQSNVNVLFCTLQPSHRVSGKYYSTSGACSKDNERKLLRFLEFKNRAGERIRCLGSGNSYTLDAFAFFVAVFIRYSVRIAKYFMPAPLGDRFIPYVAVVVPPVMAIMAVTPAENYLPKLRIFVAARRSQRRQRPNR